MRPVSRASVVLVLLLLTGCYYLAPLPARLLLTGHHSQLANEMESRYDRLGSVEPDELPYLCMAYSKLKRYNKLFHCLDEMERRPGVPLGARLWMWDISQSSHWLRAMAYIDFGDYRKAIEEASRGYERLAAGDPNPFQQAFTLSALALAYALNGERERALKHAALLESVPTGGKYTSLKTDILIELAKVHMALGDFQQALVTLQQGGAGQAAWRESTNIFFGVFVTGEDMFAYQLLPAAFMLYKSLYETGRIPEAKKGYRELLERPAAKDNRDIYWQILFDLGKIAESEGNLEEAIEFYRRAIEAIEQQRSTINTEASKIGFVGDKQQVYYRMIAPLLAEGQAAKAFEYVERSKARALVDLLASQKDFVPSTADQQQVASLVQELDKLDAEAMVQETMPSTDRSSLRSTRDLEVKAKLRTVAPELASLVTVTQVTSGAVRSLLHPNETLIEYYYHGDDLYAFIVTRDAVKAIKLNGENLTAEIRQFRAALEDRRSPRVVELSKNLYARLIKPVESLLTTGQLLIVAHGVLHYLPFSALRSGANYAIDRYSIRHLPSASVMQYLKDRKTPKSPSVLAFGNPDLGDPQYDLKFAQNEAVAIAKGFPQARLLVRKDATKTAFKTLGAQFSYLHFATHGKFDPDAPLNSGLLLASDGQNDGFLSLGELYSIRLNADLVTLSACETGLGKISNGDDVVGLTRGFLYAGSNAIVASLWEVDDQATSYLMAEFYANLKRINKREALRQAQLSTKEQYGHPFYWAAFQLTGRVE